MRQAFTRWGRPERLRVDNGAPWGAAGDLPTDLTLWPIGLEAAVDWDPPRRPQDKGVVERPQRTAKQWAEPSAWASAAELQRRLEEMDDVQRREYPSVRGRSRLEAFPKLAPSGRASSCACEWEGWSLAAVTAQLAGYAVRRRVDRCEVVVPEGRGSALIGISTGRRPQPRVIGGADLVRRESQPWQSRGKALSAPRTAIDVAGKVG